MLHLKTNPQRKNVLFKLCFALIFVLGAYLIFTFYAEYNHRVAINHPRGVGDYWLARDLAEVVSSTGYEVNIYENGNPKGNKKSSAYHIVLRGNLTDVKSATKRGKNILWLAWSNLKIQDVERTLPLEQYLQMIQESIKGYDILAIGSSKLYNLLKNKINIPLYFVPQFTNTEKFYPDYDEALASKILFVGNYHFERKAPHAVLDHNYPIDIYGDSWPEGVAKEKYIDNRILRKYYSSAEIVLNDTKENMKDFGFISNRIFDATACKAFVISDYMPEIEEIYGTSVPMYKNKEELFMLLDYYLEHPEERAQKAQQAYDITIKNFTHLQAKKMWQTILHDLP